MKYVKETILKRWIALSEATTSASALSGVKGALYAKPFSRPLRAIFPFGYKK